MVIAEISGNHGGDLLTARALVIAAKAAGADAVKTQMFTPSGMTLDSDLAHFKAKEPWNRKLYDLYKTTALPYKWIPELQKIAKELAIELFTSVYDLESLSQAEKFNMPRYKIASFEINYTELLEAVAKTQKPVILSIGTATEQEIRDAVKILGNPILLKCISKYPNDLDDLNLATIADMKDRFGCRVGFSDHTIGIFAASIAVAAGAEVVEKHITMDKTGPDGGFSLLPSEFMAMVEAINCAKLCLGKVSYETPKNYRRSMIAIEPIKKGARLKGKIKALRTTEQGNMNVGSIATKDYEIGEMINGNDTNII
ncbi:MAG: N-acetylneuraminate synthase family protein [Candidatus Peribacteraceae bacterium]|nr:N-acetylneuraminate synthase family protein [Candidatus Peribacteraceae bacterium]